jgi:hypothetical protein
MSSLMANFADRAHAEELANFAPVHETAGGRIAAARAQEEIVEAADFRARQVPAVDEWVKQHSASSHSASSHSASPQTARPGSNAAIVRGSSRRSVGFFG